MRSKWEYIPFCDAVEIWDTLRKPINSKERSARIEGKAESELYPYYGATGQVGLIDDYITDGEYVLLGEDGAPFLNTFAQKAYLINGKTWVNNYAHVLRSKTNNRFLCYYLNYFNYKGYVSGTTRLKLTQAQMKTIPIPNPDAFYGNELVAMTFKMALMNLYLHNIGDIYGNVPVTLGDALLTDPGYRVDCVLTNPPFGKKSSMTFTNEEGEQEEDELVYNRQDFWTTTSNKQLNFVQHINTILKATGKAAVVVSDNVLFEGGAGETVREKLLKTTDLHTILRLPTGIFYKPGVKANVIFFDKRPASAETQTKEIWIYDFRTNIHFTLKKNPMQDKDLDDFVSCYNPENRFERKQTWSEENPDGRWRKFSIDEVLKRDKKSLDIFWIKDKSLADLDNLPDPDELAGDIIENLQSALASFQELQEQLK